MSYTDEKPIDNLNALLKIYGYKDAESAKSELPDIRTLLNLRDTFISEFNVSMDRGRAYAIEAPWGKGKTSFVKILESELRKSTKIDQANFCWFFYDALFYGNISESIAIFLSELFKKVEETYGLTLNKRIRTIAKNLTPKVELSGIVPRLTLSYEKRDTERILTEYVRSELSQIDGKIFIIIDDIDRLTSNEAHHILRLIRVLKELPNTYILLPLAYDSLVDLLAKENIANPGGYVRKLFDVHENLEFGIDEAKKFFTFQIKKEISGTTAEVIDEAWLGYLWELCIYALRKYEVNLSNGQRLTVNIGPEDIANWSLLDPLNVGSTNTNFFKEIFGISRRNYGSTKNYVVKFKEGNNFHYRSYWQIAGAATPSMLLEGNYYAVDQVNMVGGKNMFELELYSDDVSPLGANTDDYPNIEASQISELEKSKVTLWDLIKLLPNEYFPPAMDYMISARMIKRLTEYLRDKHKEQLIESEPGNIYRSVKAGISKFIENYAKVVN